MTDAELRALAEAATPGPWLAHRAGGRGRWLVIDSSSMGFAVAGAMARAYPLDAKGEANAVYIASASPDVILALLDRIEATEAPA